MYAGVYAYPSKSFLLVVLPEARKSKNASADVLNNV
jgi:hypothetical protein